MKQEIIKKLKILAEKAYKKNEVPIGALIVWDGKIISEAYNNKEKKHNVIGHAEAIAIKKAAKKLKTWKLDEAILYTTLEPCRICTEIIKASRIKKVYYLSKSVKKVNYKTEFLFKRIVFFENIIKTFFKDKRN